MACHISDDRHKLLSRGATGCSRDGTNNTHSDVSWPGIVSSGAESRLTMLGDVLDACDSSDNVLSNKGCILPQRGPQQGLDESCASCALSIVCATESGTRELGTVRDRAAAAGEAPDDVLTLPDSNANALNNRGGMPLER